MRSCYLTHKNNLKKPVKFLASLELECEFKRFKI